MRIELFKDIGGCWRWHLVAGNHEILATSEAYAKKGNARRSAELLQKEFLGSETGFPVVESGRVRA